MSLVRATGTKLEKVFLRFLRAQGITKGYNLDRRNLLGRPDVVFEKEKLCFFVDSDFWHGWQFPRWKHKLKEGFWRDKIQKNRERDREVTRGLRSRGWRVVRLWEHDLIRRPDKILGKLKKAIGSFRI